MAISTFLRLCLIFLGVCRKLCQNDLASKRRHATHGVGLLLALLTTTTQTEDKVEGGLLLDVVVAEGAAILKLLASKDQALLVGRDPGERQ